MIGATVTMGFCPACLACGLVGKPDRRQTSSAAWRGSSTVEANASRRLVWSTCRWRVTSTLIFVEAKRSVQVQVAGAVLQLRGVIETILRTSRCPRAVHARVPSTRLPPCWSVSDLRLFCGTLLELACRVAPLACLRLALGLRGDSCERAAPVVCAARRRISCRA